MSDKLDVAEAFRALDELIAQLGPTADHMTERDKAFWIVGFHAGHARRTPPPATKAILKFAEEAQDDPIFMKSMQAIWRQFLAEWPEQK